MGIDSPTAMSIATASFLCITAVSLAIGDEVQDPDPASIEEMLQMDGDVLSKINARAIIYLEGGEQTKLEKQESAMHQKLKDVAGYALGANITAVDTLYFFPLEGRTESIFGGESFPACGTAGSIPAHLHGIRGAGLFQAFIEKYSEYPITLYLQDEQGSKPLFHYGFSAASGDGNFASILFHADTCTGEIIDLHGYRLLCHDTQEDYFFGSGNPGDTAASMTLDEFCIIPVDPWRQLLYDYVGKISEESRRHFEEGGHLDDHETFMIFWHEGERLDALTELAYMAASDNFADDAIQEKIQEYRDVYGTLPDKFLRLLENLDGR